MKFNYEYHCSLNTEFTDCHDVPFIDMIIYVLYVRLRKIKSALVNEKIMKNERPYDNYVIMTFTPIIEFYKETLISFRKCHRSNGKAIHSHIAPKVYDDILIGYDHARPKCTSSKKIDARGSKKNVDARGSKKNVDVREPKENVNAHASKKSTVPPVFIDLDKKQNNENFVDDFLLEVSSCSSKKVNLPTSFATRSNSFDQKRENPKIANPVENFRDNFFGDTKPELGLYHSKKQIELLYVNVIDQSSIKKVLIYDVLTDAVRNGTHEKFLTYDGDHVNFYFIKMVTLQNNRLKLMEVLMNDQMSGMLLVNMIQIKNDGFGVEKVMIFKDDMTKIMTNTREDYPRYMELLIFEDKKPKSMKTLINNDNDKITSVFRIKPGANSLIPTQIERVCLFNSDIKNIKESMYDKNICFQQMLMKEENQTILIDVLFDKT
jgi:hypothetical protein